MTEADESKFIDDKNLAYHCSAHGDIKELVPHESSHGKAYVYATPYRILSLVFGIKEHCDYIIHPVVDENGNYTLIEMSPDALAKHYRDRNAYIYTVKRDDFDIRTQWDGEICSSKSVQPLNVEYIPDLEKAILKEQEAGRIRIISYDERNNNGENLDEKFANRILTDILKHNNDDTYLRENIHGLKHWEGKELFRCFQKRLKHYIDCFKIEEQVTSQEKKHIIPQQYLEKYKNSYDDRTMGKIFEILSDISTDKIPLAINEIKSTCNVKLLDRIIKCLSKVDDLTKEGDLLHVISSCAKGNPSPQKSPLPKKLMGEYEP